MRQEENATRTNSTVGQHILLTGGSSPQIEKPRNVLGTPFMFCNFCCCMLEPSHGGGEAEVSELRTRRARNFTRKMTSDACYEKGSTFWPNRFLNGGAP